MSIGRHSEHRFDWFSSPGSYPAAAALLVGTLRGLQPSRPTAVGARIGAIDSAVLARPGSLSGLLLVFTGLACAHPSGMGAPSTAPELGKAPPAPPPTKSSERSGEDSGTRGWATDELNEHAPVESAPEPMVDATVATPDKAEAEPRGEGWFEPPKRKSRRGTKARGDGDSRPVPEPPRVARSVAAPAMEAGRHDHNKQYNRFLQSEQLTLAASRHPTFRVIEGDLDAVGQELKLQLRRVFDAAAAVPVGRLVGAEILILCKLEVHARGATWLARLIGVETGEMLSAARVEMDERVLRSS